MNFHNETRILFKTRILFAVTISFPTTILFEITILFKQSLAGKSTSSSSGTCGSAKRGSFAGLTPTSCLQMSLCGTRSLMTRWSGRTTGGSPTTNPSTTMVMTVDHYTVPPCCWGGHIQANIPPQWCCGRSHRRSSPS